MNHDPYSSPGASFGAEGLSPVPPPTALDNAWMWTKLLTPQWLKEAATITVGVFGALTLFRVFQRKLPKPQ